MQQGRPAAIETALGWVIIGSTTPMRLQAPTTQLSLHTLEDRLDETLQKFWRTEEVGSVMCSDPNDDKAEEHFTKTHSRTPSGKYMVRLPFAELNVLPPFGESRMTALRRWHNLENKMANNGAFQTAYNDFMLEYLEKGHMQPAERAGIYFIPHFAILRDSPTSPVRVVFDASCADTSGFSLNDRLLTGPPLQKDITEILTFFRLEKIALTTDIKMMYRQIWLHPADRSYQHILWRPNDESPVKEYEFGTVTYGLAPAPFLAQRVLLQLVKDHGTSFPLAKQAVSEFCFMDDICVSIGDEAQAIRLKNELIQLLQLAGFELRKWSSNSTIVMEDIPVEHRAPGLAIHSTDQRTFPNLGLYWSPKDDVFSYKTRTIDLATTKRAVLSHVASIYDPLGWIAPVVFWAKCFLQDLWSQGVTWDETLPDNVAARWAEFASQLLSLNSMKMPRLCKQPEATRFQLVGICDASNRGYAAAIYLRSSSRDKDSSVSLLKGKTKVAPLKVLTIPRLELNDALLLANLLRSVASLQRHLDINDVFLFCDSQVVLSWLQTQPHKLTTYVANRVVRILEDTKIEQWHHVSSADNSADCASRGLLPSDLIATDIWWKGSEFLQFPIEIWSLSPLHRLDEETLPDVKNHSIALLALSTSPPSDDQFLLTLVTRLSSFTKLQRVVAWVKRFAVNARCSPTGRCTGVLSVLELESATKGR